MRYRGFACLTFAVMLTACIVLTVPGAFTAIRGPLSIQSPTPPVYTAKMTGAFSGTISVVLANGELCTGPWSFISNSAAQTGAGSPTTNTAPIDLSADWDLVYGPGFYLAHVVGNRLRARATLTGNMGTLVYVELSNETNTRGNTKGVSQEFSRSLLGIMFPTVFFAHRFFNNVLIDWLGLASGYLLWAFLAYLFLEWLNRE